MGAFGVTETQAVVDITGYWLQLPAILSSEDLVARLYRLYRYHCSNLPLRCPLKIGTDGSKLI